MVLRVARERRRTADAISDRAAFADLPIPKLNAAGFVVSRTERDGGAERGRDFVRVAGHISDCQRKGVRVTEPRRVAVTRSVTNAVALASGIHDTERLAEPDTVRDTERYAIRSYRRDDREGRRAPRERSVVGAAHRSAGRGRAGRARCARRAGNADDR